MQHSRITGGNEGYRNRGRLAQSVVLAAWAHGIGLRIRSIYPEENERRARELLGVPADLAVRTAISLGYPAGPEAEQFPR